MSKTLQQLFESRRTYYALQPKSPISDEAITELLKSALWNLPSPFNSQSSRFVLLLGKEHTALWQIVKETLKAKVPADAFVKTEAKIDNGFAAGYATILFFEDTAVVEGLQKSFPSYAANFPLWSQQTSGLHQLTVWLLLEESGCGASLQHYNPLIDDAVKTRWNLPASWQLVAQMPFGTPAKEPEAKEHLPLEDRLKVFG
ncbi:MAG: nitroreductase family protein [Planctomycetaceae bacterium]|jgi:predicted oxidoreductase (fatty acid repression mutant protein)|nr:nitroreductase family protein [Planctomycetaceae bacterium]